MIIFVKKILLVLISFFIILYIILKQNGDDTPFKKNIVLDGVSESEQEELNLVRLSPQKKDSVPTIDGWKLIWHDEFEKPYVNRSNWNMENWASEKNNELQYYSPKNIVTEDGLLKIISRKENYGGREFTSGAMHTKDKFSFLYGKVEMRAKLPKGKGIFPAFWMMPNQDQTWLPEIDIMEMLGHKPEEIWMVLHWLNEDQKLTSVSSSYTGKDYSEDFHTFGIEWSEDQVVWLIDGVERFKTDIFVPKEEMYLYVNTAIGGNWPGSPNESTPFPQLFLIDYIRVFQKEGNEND
ncbi:glycoside hydrolase family 16 protein [Fervidibacillus albus]|uniref:Glycoside hydrolase family 16 protein n=1 Tax=Fervidibacillus albus TaxID=2980026 RepID=A0A9E8LSU7_9BACI|nr:glycoside hydrolase family 16 protein [Fervidibacillus albus]WAA08561.1 glycoside hydrolase family 16 protein [Fervidibacillus albus]